jgi:serine protease Do
VGLLSISDFVNTEQPQMNEVDPSSLDSVRTEERIQEISKKIHELGKLLGSGRSLPALRNVVDLTQIAAQVMPATVRIETTVTSKTLFSNPNQNFAYLSGGSGFIISEDGYIVTNHHVINGAGKISVIFNRSGRSFPAVVKGSDPETDIALLKIEGVDFPYLPFADSDLVRVGEGAILIGNPFGYRDLLTLGVIGGKASGLANTYNGCFTRKDTGVYADYLISDARINPGNSGGAILNLQGEVIGVASMGGSGLGLHIASNTASKVVDELMRNGHVTRSYFGALLWTFDQNDAEMISLEGPFQNGLIVGDLLKDSPAMQSGLRKGDVILRYNDIPITTHQTFCTDLAMKMPPGSLLKLSVLRGGEISEVVIQLGARQVNVTTPIQNMGIGIENLEDEKSIWWDIDSNIEGVFVSNVSFDSPFGLRSADVITGVIIGLNQEVPTRNVDEFLKVIDQYKNMILIVRSPDRSRPNYYPVNL